MKDRVVLAYGETTGHAHAFNEATKVEYNGSELKIKDKTDLTHEEHTKHGFDTGEGTVTIQRTYTQGQLKRVAD